MNDLPRDPAAEESLEQLITEAKSGSAEAFDQLIRSCQSYLLLIANQELSARFRGKLGASDVVQSALVLAHRNLEKFEGKSKEELLGWLRAILLNEVKTAHRRFTAHKRNVDREVDAANSTAKVDPEDEARSPRSTASVNEEAAALRSAMESMPEDYRRVIMLREWDGLPFEEVGLRMNRSAEAARKLWARAMRQLKGVLRHELE